MSELVTISDLNALLAAARWWVEHGSMLDILPLLPEDSIDSCVCDPPYELGFMGRKWDRSGIAFRSETWGEVLRVLKPGAHLLAFGGSRTAHRIACAIEDAGFEIRDSIEWAYGCLSDDTELLMDGQWVPFTEARAGSRALTFDVASGDYAWLPIQEVFVYDHDGVAYEITSGATDQLVTRNHRCIVDQGNGWEFVIAEEASRQPEIRVPVLENLCGVPGQVRGFQSIPGRTQQDLLAQVLWASDCVCEERRSDLQRKPASALPDMRAPLQKVANEAPRAEAAGVLASVPRGALFGHASIDRSEGSSRLDRNFAEVVFGKNERLEQPCLEGRSYVLPKARQLQAHQVRPLPAGVSTNGAEGRLRHGASLVGGASSKALLAANGSGSSCGSRSAKQRPLEPGTICKQPGSQAARESWLSGSTLARIRPRKYVGKVWCIKVPTGAFVARRNGKAFVTGNSGFPKSLNVSKAIDASFGAVGTAIYSEQRYNEASGIVDAGRGERRLIERTVRAPATAAAAAAAGWGTALKPSHEPVIVARKPLRGTVAQNFIDLGTGAINIDACRVAHASAEDLAAHEEQVAAIKSRGGSMEGSWKNSSDLSGASDVNSAGRWPPNLLLTHSAECRIVGVRQVKANPTWATPNRECASTFTGETVSEVRHTEDVVRQYECVEGCPVRELDEQSGEKQNGSLKPIERANRSGFGGPMPAIASAVSYGDLGTASRYFPQSEWTELDDASPFFYTAKAARSERDRGLDGFMSATGGEATGRVDGSAGTQNPRAGAGRKGGSRNIHPTVKPIELLRWLVRLATPPKGIVLDPFAGSGSCGIATVLEGFRYLGIELNNTDAEPFVDIARARIAHVIGGYHVPRPEVQSRRAVPVQASLLDLIGGAK